MLLNFYCPYCEEPHDFYTPQVKGLNFFQVIRSVVCKKELKKVRIRISIIKE